MTVAHSKKRAATSPLMQAFRDVVDRWPRSEWLVDDSGCVAALQRIADEYRNRAAHLDELSADDFRGCRALVIGREGFLERLVDSTADA